MKHLVPFLLLFTPLFTSCEVFCEEESTNLPNTSGGKIYGCTHEDSFNYNPEATDDNGSCKPISGCLGYAPGFEQSGVPINTLGDPFYDQLTEEEVSIQRGFWDDFKSSFYLLQEHGNTINAWADSRGEIIFGKNMFYHILNNYGSTLPAAGVIAHEFAHRAQQELGWTYYKPEYQELEADAFSGFYMALVKQHAWSEINTFFANTYASGDYEFNTRAHHGTPGERVACAYLGFDIALYAIQNGVQFSYNDLHQIFIEEIQNNIAPRTSYLDKEYPEIAYPENLTPEYIQSLYPKK